MTILFDAYKGKNSINNWPKGSWLSMWLTHLVLSMYRNEIL